MELYYDILTMFDTLIKKKNLNSASMARFCNNLEVIFVAETITESQMSNIK